MEEGMEGRRRGWRDGGGVGREGRRSRGGERGGGMDRQAEEGLRSARGPLTTAATITLAGSLSLLIRKQEVVKLVPS